MKGNFLMVMKVAGEEKYIIMVVIMKAAGEMECGTDGAKEYKKMKLFKRAGLKIISLKETKNKSDHKY